MLRKARLTLDALEDRCTPSSLGQPWPNPGQLTVSFAPDGTVIDGAPSNLFQTLNRVAPTAQWQQLILKAFQTWAVDTNVNIGLVADGGQPFAAPGAVQGDPRFGDIRIGMQALPANLVATTAPFSWTGSTWSGDVIFNSSYNFGVNGNGQYDLFSVALHEAGHALGIPDNSTDVSSIMYANYTGVRSGLDGLDVANVQALYGARTATDSNHTMATATSVGNAPSQLGFNAVLSTATDVDYYKIVTPLLGLGGSITAQIDVAGLSLLEPTVSVFNASGKLLATQSASDSFSNNVGVTIPTGLLSATYYIEVSSPGTGVFGIGDYSADITYKSLVSSIVGIVPSLIQGVVNTVDHTNTSTASATMLTAPYGDVSDQRFNYLYQANLAYGGDADYYRFQAPAAPSSTGTYALDAIVWQTVPGGLAPVLHLFDANGNPIAAQVLADTSGVYSVQLPDVTPGATFFVEVAGQTASGPTSTGGYIYGVKFNTLPETVAPLLGSDTLATASSTDTGTLAMNQNGVFYFELAAANGSSSVSSNLTMTVTDQNGNVVLSLTAATGSAPRTAAVYLAAGTYTIDYNIVSTSGAYLPVTYWMSGEILSDPIGPYYSGATAPPMSSSNASGGSSSGATAPPMSSSNNSGGLSSGPSTVSSTTTFASSGASVSIRTASGTVSVPIPPPGSSATWTFTTSSGTTTVTMTTASNGVTTLTLTTPSTNTVTNTTTLSGNTSTQTVATSDGITVTIITPVTTPAPSYAGPSAGTAPPYYY